MPLHDKVWIPVSAPSIGETELRYVTECVKSGWVSSLGKFISTFEEKFSNFCGCKYGIACSNGTAALHLTLESLGISAGDEVLVPTLTFISTANAVKYTRAKPVFVDSEPYTWNIDHSNMRRKITNDTKAVIVVHLYGHPANMSEILEIAEANNLYVIEDAAEAHGAEYKGRKVGGIGNVGCFSFYGNKIITTGEGGMLVSNDKGLIEEAKMLRDHAMSETKRYWHNKIGFNYRMTNLQAALGVAQMERIDEFINRKREIAKLYNSLLDEVSGVTLPPEERWAKNVYWMYSILVGDDFGCTREALAEELKKKGIDSRPFFYPIHSQPPYVKCAENGRFPVAEGLSRRGINLPSSVTLKDEEVIYIAEAIKKIYKQNRS